MKLRSALLGATILVAPVAAMAQPISGLYVGAAAGLNYRQNQDIKDITVGKTTTSTTGGAHLKTDFGFGALGAVGYGLGNGLRFEIEGSWRNNKAQKASGSAVFGGSLPAGGNVQTAAAMVNAAYDFNTGSFLTPYVGAGVGYADERLHNVHINSGTTAYTVNGDKGELAAQAFVGVAVATPVPGLSVTAEYRFFAGLGSDSFHGSVTAPKTTSATLSEKFGNQYNHAGLIGVRYAFGVSPLAVIVEPPPVVTPSYLVFFDWDKATLTARARQIIATAATNSTKQQYTRIEVNGYTDTSGTPRYNQGLSVRRAQSVAAELVRDGVPRQAISINGFGETHPLVPTGPGVREPQNRRVEIFIK